jgi:hypothetical protein
MDPGTAMLIATAVATAAKAGGDALSNSNANKAAKRRAKEAKRETQAGVLQDTLSRSAELSAHGLQGRNKMGKRKAQSINDTAEMVRGALKI